MNKYCDYFVEQLIKNRIIQREDREIYLYGSKKILFSGVNYFFFLLIGGILQVPFHALIFLLTFVPLRIHGGGIHAKSKMRCFIYSNIMAYLVLSSIKYCLGNFVKVILLINVLAFFFLYTYIPINCSNDKRSKEEKSHFKKNFGYIIMIENIATIIMILFNQTILSYTIQVGILAENVLLLLGKINKLRFFNIIE